ncbi:MAG: L-lactate permease [Chloroflexota bacterium]
MTADFNWLNYLIAWIPVLVILVGMVAFTMSAVRTGLASWVVGSILALLFFSFDLNAITLATAKGTLLAFDIMVIIGGALFLYFVVETSGAIDKIKWSIIGMTNDRTMQVLVIAVGFAGFLHGIAGFGVPPAVTAPILMALGFSAMDACVLTLIGYSSYMVWGTWGIGPTTGANLTQIPIQNLVPTIGVLEAPLWFFEPILMVGVVLGWRVLGRYWVPIVVQSAVGTAVMLLLSIGFRTPEFIGWMSGAAAMFTAYLFTRLPQYKGEGPAPRPITGGSEAASLGAGYTGTMGIWRAVFPYLLVIAVLFPIRVVPAINQSLNSVVVSVALGGAAGSWVWRPLTQIGVLLAVCSVIGGMAQGLDGRGFARAFRKTMGPWIPSAIACFGFMTMSEVMNESAMMRMLAVGTAAIVGGLIYPFVAPFVGWLGCIITGSGVSTNILFARFQQDMAVQLNQDPTLYVATNNSGGGASSMSTPNKIIPAAAVTGILGREGEIMRRTMPISLALTAFVGVFTLILAQIR